MNHSQNHIIQKYTDHSDRGYVQQGYKALIHFIQDLRIHFKNLEPSKYSVGSFYQGYMDITYFPIFNSTLKRNKLKVGLVFNHEKMQFELWLLGQNKKVQKEHWERFKDLSTYGYRLSESPHQSISEIVIEENPDYSDLKNLANAIEQETLSFIDETSKLL